MGIIKMSLRLMIADLKRTIFYAISLTLSISIIFVFFCYIDNDILGNSMSGGGFSQILALMVIVFAIFNCVFANNFFVAGKTNEIAISELNGTSVFGVALYLLVQNFVIMTICLIVGFFLGYFFNAFFNSLVYSKMGVTGNIFYVPTDGLIWGVIVIFTELFFLTMMNTGFAYRKDIKDLLSAEDSMNLNVKKSRIPSIVYWILYIVPFIIYFKIDLETSKFMVYTVIGLFGINGLLKKGISELIIRRQKKHLNQKISLIAYGNLSSTIKKSGLLLNMLVLSVIMIIGLIISYQKDKNTQYLLVLTYYIIIFLMSTSILYNLINEVTLRNKLYSSLFKLGYLKKDLKRIMRKEITLFYLVILFFPTSYASVMLFRFVFGNVITFEFALTLLLSYIIPIILTGFIVYVVYVKSILSKLGGPR